MANKFITHGESIFNSLGGDNDFRIEGDTQDHAFFLDASTSRVGIHQSSPSYPLDVNGAIHAETNVIIGSSNASPGTLILNDNSTTAYTLAFKGTGTRGYQMEGSASSGAYSLTLLNAGTGAFNMSVDGVLSIGETTSPFSNDALVIRGQQDGTAIKFEAGGTHRFDLDCNGTGTDNLSFNNTDGTQYLTIYRGAGVVVNNSSGGSHDFQVKSSSSTHALFVDATNGNIGINDSAPSSTLASGISATGRVLSIASGGTTAISIRATDSVNDRNAVIEMLSTGNGGSDNIIVFGDTDTTPATPSGLQLQGYHNGSRVARWYMDSNAAIYWHKASAGGGWLTAELAKTHLGSDSAGTADISFTITFTNSSGTYDNFQVMLYLSLSGNSAPASTSVYEIRGLQRSSAVSIGRTTLVSGESRSITTSTSGLDLTITLASAGSSTATQGAVCRVLGAYYGISKIVSGDSS